MNAYKLAKDIRKGDVITYRGYPVIVNSVSRLSHNQVEVVFETHKMVSLIFNANHDVMVYYE